MKNKIIFIISLLGILISTTSCVELVEEINIHPDRSGTYRFYVKTNGMGFLLQSLPVDLQTDEIVSSVQAVQNQKGISHFQSDIQPKQARFDFSFDFDRPGNLNKAFYQVMGVKKQFYHKSVYKIKGSKIIKENTSSYLIRYLKNNDFYDLIPQKVLAYVKYTVKINLPEVIQSCSPENETNIPATHSYKHSFSLQKMLIDQQSNQIQLTY